MASPQKESGGVADAPERDEHADSFDPGVETGYLRRAPRDHDLDIDSGRAPFDPGDDHYDERRARREAKRREKEERARREAEQRRAADAAKREAEARRREQEAARERERAARELERERERIRDLEESQRRADDLRAKRELSERGAAERAERARAERERLQEAERAERDAREREREERKRAERAERDRALAEEEGRRRAEREKRDRRARQRPIRRAAPRPKPAKVAVRPAAPPTRKQPAAKVAGVSPAPSLHLPTAKAVLAIAGVVAVALAFGGALGLPMPLIGGETDETPASVTPNEVALAGITPGTPVGLTAGPYNPVVQPTGYGEGAAKFHAARGGRKHEGQDIFGAPGTPLVAVRDAIVLDGAGGRSFYASGGGNTLVLYSPVDNRSYIYLHMLKPALVKAGDEVKAGQLVGLLGCTGSCDGPHLHFEIRLGRAYWGAETKAIDPLPLVRSWPQRPAAKVEPAAKP